MLICVDLIHGLAGSQIALKLDEIEASRVFTDTLYVFCMFSQHVQPAMPHHSLQ
jgi:hypothetical protein